jgi:hypothetical protein
MEFCYSAWGTCCIQEFQFDYDITICLHNKIKGLSHDIDCFLYMNRWSRPKAAADF